MKRRVYPGIARLEKNDPGPSEEVKLQPTCSILARWPSFRFFYEATLDVSSRFYFEATGSGELQTLHVQTKIYIIPDTLDYVQVNTYR